MQSENEQTTEKVGVYICHCGGNISDHVDVDKVAEAVKNVPGVTVSRTNMFMCSDPGQELIMEDIKNGTVNRVVVASCAPSLHETTFRSAIKRAGMNPYLYEHANIREQVSWVHHGDPATKKAEVLIHAAVEKAKNVKELEPIRMEARKHVLVIGGGVAGLRNALDLSRLGLQVTLVEKSPFLGGQAANLNTIFPTGEKASDLLNHLYQLVVADSNITVHTCAEVIKFEGYVGNFKLTIQRRPPGDKEDIQRLEQFNKAKAPLGDLVPFAGILPTKAAGNEDAWTEEVGAIVLATGFKTYPPAMDEYGYGTFPQVITLPDLIREMANGKARGRKLEFNGRPVSRVALIHCVGSRQIPGVHEPDAEGNLNEYCSRTCCSSALHAANLIRETYPETHVFDFYRDIRTYGRGQEDIYEQAGKNNVLFFRFEAEEPPVVNRSEKGDHPLNITVRDTLTFNEELAMGVDLVVLVVGMVSGNASGLADLMKLPVGPDRFLLEVHPKLRPVELAGTGMFLAGTCQAPMDIGESCAAAQAAASKASAMLSKGYVERDPFVAEVDTNRCKGHGACVDVCLVEGAIRLEPASGQGENNRAVINPGLCTGCGMCVAECPENAIDINGWALQQYEAMVDAIAAL